MVGSKPSMIRAICKTPRPWYNGILYSVYTLDQNSLSSRGQDFTDFDDVPYDSELAGCCYKDSAKGASRSQYLV